MNNTKLSITIIGLELLAVHDCGMWRYICSDPQRSGACDFAEQCCFTSFTTRITTEVPETFTSYELGTKGSKMK